MCSRFCSKVFEQAAEHPELLDGVGIFSIPPVSEYYDREFLAVI